MVLRLRTVVEGRTEQKAEPRTVDFPTGVGEIRIGRRQDLELPLPFPALSGVHARLLRDGDGRWVVEDLGSRNGTTLDGQRLDPGERRPLAAGSRIGFAVVAVISEGEVSRAPTPLLGAEGTGTIARRLVNDLFAGEPGAGAPTLTVVAGAPAATLRLDALDRRYVVGRVEGTSLQIVADEISREHLAFTRTWDGVTVHDLGSKNGFRINGTRATTQRLHDGDVLEIGPVALQFTDPADRYLRELEAQAEPPPAEPAARAPRPALPPAAPPPVVPTAKTSRGTRTAILAAAIILFAIGATAIALALGAR